MSKYVKEKREIGKNILDLRKKAGLSQDELAYRAKIERSYMGKIERGEGNPSLGKLISIAKALNTDLKTLFTI